MKLVHFVSFALLAVSASAVAIPSDFEARGQPGEWCEEPSKYLGNPFHPECVNLATDCIYHKLNGTQYLWSKTSCVAAATCSGSHNVYVVANCSSPAIPIKQESVPSLSFNIYANIVGSCAYDQPQACPITFQKYVDWFYGSLSAIGSTSWPPNVEFVRENYWNPITNWTATGDVIPYNNFNDWLHWGPEWPWL